MFSYLFAFSDKFSLAIGLWPFASLLLTLPVLAMLYHRDGRVSIWTALGSYLAILYALGLVCFTLYPLPDNGPGATGPGITYGIPPQLDPLAFIGDIRRDGLPAALQVIMNVALFVPFGFIFARGHRLRWQVVLVLGFATSLLIETAQLTGLFFSYPHAYRTFDVDDLAANTLGAGAGCALAWLVGRVLPSSVRESLEPTRKPGFVRRVTAFCLDMILSTVLTIVIAAVTQLAFRSAGQPEPFADGGMLRLSLAVLAVIELVVPALRGGCTPGGGFVRMTCETKVRTGWRRALFLMLRFAVIAVSNTAMPVAYPILGLFYLVKRQMPYDLLP